MVKNHFKIAGRNIIRHKGNAVINIFGLSLGICASLIIYLITSFELSYDDFHPDQDRIYRLVAVQQDNQGNKEGIGFVMNPLPMALRNELTGFENVTEFHNYYARVTIPNEHGEPKRFDAAKRGEEVSPIIIAEQPYFALFHYQWLEGNPATALNEPFKVVLSEREAYRYFGQKPLEEIMGKDIFYADVYRNDSLHLTVSGIVKDWDKNTDLAFKDFISFATIRHSFLKEQIHTDHWGNWNPNAQGFVKLAKGITPAQVERQFPKFLEAHVPPYPGHTTQLSLQPLSDLHFNSFYRDVYSRKAHLPSLYILMGIAVFILVIAAINFINLSTAQSFHRAKEIGVRKVLGSSRANLRRQFLIETFLITSISVVISLVLAWPLLHIFHSMMPAGVSLHLSSPSTLLFLALITIVTTLLAGFYPAEVLSSHLPVINLKGQTAKKFFQTEVLRKGLIVFQFTVSLVFIICTLVIGKQIRFMMNKDLGFTKDAIVSFRTGWNEPIDQAGIFAEKVRQIAGVQLVSTHLETPVAKSHSNTYIQRVDNPEFKPGASYEMCDEHYVPLYDLHIIAGRNILHSDTVREFLVNETCVRELGFKKGEDALGIRVQNGMNEAKGTIVGVVKDFHSKSLHEPIRSFFLSSDKNSERSISVKLATREGNISHFRATMAAIEKIWKELYPNEKFEYSFFDETIARLYATEQRASQLMNAAMVIAVLISCMGLLGLAIFTIQRRTKEIGVRKVLGASVAGIVSILCKDFVILVIIALVIASPVSWYFMHGWLQDFAYRVPIGGWVFLIAGLAAIGITLITISYQAVKAAIASPIKALRTGD